MSLEQARLVIELAVDRAIYTLDPESGTYRYARRNPDWRRLSRDENERNKQRLDGCTRIFPDGRRRRFAYRPTHAPPRRPSAVTVGTELAELQASIRSLCAFAATAPPTADRASGWGVPETLAHLVFWHEQYGRTVRALLAHREPALPDGTFVAINARAVEELAPVPIGQLIARLEAAQQGLAVLIADPAASDLGVPIKAGSKVRPMPEFVARVEAHVRGHEALLRAARAAGR